MGGHEYAREGVSGVPAEPRYSAAGGLAALIIHGFLVWFAIPPAAVVWLLLARGARARGITFRKYIGWVDLNLMACLERTLLRAFIKSPLDWVPASAMAATRHRLGLTVGL